jgi:hypothetical protein
MKGRCVGGPKNGDDLTSASPIWTYEAEAELFEDDAAPSMFDAARERETRSGAYEWFQKRDGSGFWHWLGWNETE